MAAAAAAPGTAPAPPAAAGAAAHPGLLPGQRLPAERLLLQVQPGLLAKVLLPLLLPKQAPRRAVWMQQPGLPCCCLPDWQQQAGLHHRASTPHSSSQPVPGWQAAAAAGPAAVALHAAAAVVALACWPLLLLVVAELCSAGMVAVRSWRHGPACCGSLHTLQRWACLAALQLVLGPVRRPALALGLGRARGQQHALPGAAAQCSVARPVRSA